MSFTVAAYQHLMRGRAIYAFCLLVFFIAGFCFLMRMTPPAYTFRPTFEARFSVLEKKLHSPHQKKEDVIGPLKSSELLQKEELRRKDLVLFPGVREETGIVSYNTVQLAVYLGAQCPDTSLFFHRHLLPTFIKLWKTGRLSVYLNPYGKSQCTPFGSGYNCYCQHGPDECSLGILMGCVMHLITDPVLYIPIVGCIQGKDNIGEAEKLCINRQNIVEPARLMQCAKSIEGQRFFYQYGQMVAQLDPPLNFVPWIMIDGVRVVDAFYALEQHICRRMMPPPAECSRTV